MSSNRARIVEACGLAALLGATLWVFWGCLDNPFHFDDSLFLENTQVTEPGNLRAILRPTQIRPLTYLTFLANYRAGGVDPRPYHRLNLALHLVTVALVYGLVRLLAARSPELEGSPLRPLLPLASAAIFALNPVQSEPVNYVYQRSTMLAALFGVLCLYLGLVAGERRSRGALSALAAAAALVAVAGKESAASVPLVLGAYFLVVPPAAGSWRARLAQSRTFLAVAAGLSLGAGAWALFLLHRFGERTAGIHAARGNPLEYLLAQIQVVPRYLGLVLWPAGLSVDPDPAIAPPASGRGLVSLALVAGIVALTLAARRRWPLGAFLALAFFILIAPTSSLVPSADLMFEHRLYLPMVALAPLLGLLVAGAVTAATRARPALARPLFVLAAVGLATAYGAAARARTRVWSDNVLLWEDAVAKAPLKARAHYNLGVACIKRDRGRARAALERALELRPDHPQSLYNLGWLEQTSGRYGAARRCFERALAVDPTFWQALQSLGNLDVLENRLDAARAHYGNTLALRPDYWPAILALGTLELRRQDFRAARGLLQRVSELRPDLLEARFQLAYACIGIGDRTQAEAQLRHLESRDRDGLFRERIDDLRSRVARRP